MGWQRQRAWMEVFSSLEMTYSSVAERLRRRQVRAYRSSTRAALAAKSGSRMKIQDRYCQGLSASAASQRRTVEAEIAAAMPAADGLAGQFGAGPPRQRHAGLGRQLAGQRLDLGHLHRR